MGSGAFLRVKRVAFGLEAFLALGAVLAEATVGKNRWLDLACLVMRGGAASDIFSGKGPLGYQNAKV